MRFSRGSLTAALACLALASFALAEEKGLDWLSDEPLIQELARYGMDNLLERYGQANPGAVEQRPGIGAMMSIRALVASGDKMTPAQRQQLVRRIVGGADVILPAMRDPRELMHLANVLITEGMERNANTIEYWGENPRSQAQIRPIAELVAKVLDACSKSAREQADNLVASFGNSPTPAQLKEYTALDNLATTARYTRSMSDYYRAMAFPNSDPKRAQIADAAIEALREFDAADTRIQPIVRLRIGKLQMVRGDYAGAKKTLESVAANPNNEIAPAPDVLQRHEARYFIAISDLLARDQDAAAKAGHDLAQWDEKYLPRDKAIRQGAQASLEMLNYRLKVLNAELAGNDAEKKDAAEKANAILWQLAKDRPELRSVIFEQLASSVPDDAPMSGLDTLLLRALVRQGMSEQFKTDGAEPDKKAIACAIAAARQVISRKDQPGVDADTVDDVAIALPQLCEKLGQDAEAAKAYLSYIEIGKTSAYRSAAMQNALVAIGRLKAADAGSAVAGQLLDQALPLAVNQFGRKELAYDLGRRLEGQGKYAEAVAAYQQVPASDNRFVVSEFYRMQLMKQDMDAAGKKLDAAQKGTRIGNLCKLAADVRKLAANARDVATAPADKDRYGLIEARARLMTATLLRQSDPGGAVSVLDGFDQSIAGLPGAGDLKAEALFLRIDALMAMSENKRAADSLLELLQTKAGDQGAALIFALLTRLDADLDLARKAQDTVKVKSLLDARAALSGPLVDWAKNNKDERIRKYTYQYMVFNAATKQQAAMADPDPQRRLQGLRDALKLYDKLLDGDSIKLWAATVDPAKVDVRYGDVTVLYAKALVLYELAEYHEAAGRLARLLEDRKLGTPRIITAKDGEMTGEDNPQYWEATFKLYRCNVEMVNDPATPNARQLLEDTRNGLKRLYIREGDGVGGDKWKDEFAKLRQQIIPGFQVQ